MEKARPTANRRNQTAAILLALPLGVALYFFSPAEYSFYPRCLFHSLTGLDCPGCGSLRALHQLLHGNFRAAFGLNPLLVFLLPGLIIFSIRPVRGQWDFGANKTWLWIGLSGLTLFAISRNLTAFF